MLADGKNVISAVLGRGHYSGFCGYSGAMIYGKESSFIAMLNIVYTRNKRGYQNRQFVGVY